MYRESQRCENKALGGKTKKKKIINLKKSCGSAALGLAGCHESVFPKKKKKKKESMTTH